MIVVDFHIHSRFSRATSKSLNLELLDKTAQIKGVQVLGTGDFTHPLWFKELEENLEQAEPGLYKLKKSKTGTRFVLSCEVSSIYSKGGKVRKVHTLLIVPSMKIAREINKNLSKVGNLHSDGRPILGLDVKNLAQIVFNISEDALVVPAHSWTPWFSVFGSKSGFDSLEECFEEVTSKIYAIETGLSSDPAMNWRLSSLDNVAIISNSDCHSAQKIAREANVFDCGLSYFSIVDAIKNKDKNKFLYTIEFFPEEGKYHYDGHRLCKFSRKPSVALVNEGKSQERKSEICPKCGRALTIGVLSRIEELSDRPEGFIPENAIPYKNLIPLEEIIGEAYGVGAKTKTVEKEYSKLIDAFGTELSILLNISPSDIMRVAGELVAEAISKMRKGEVNISPGYDGEYGKINILNGENIKKLSNKQASLI